MNPGRLGDRWATTREARCRSSSPVLDDAGESGAPSDWELVERMPIYSGQVMTAGATTLAPTFPTFLWRVVSTHMITYFAVGLLAFQLLDYRHLYSETELRHLMRSTSSPWVAAGGALQLVRGALYAVVLWPLNVMLVSRSWLVLFGLFVGLAILGTAGPAPGSLEGAIFTTLPPRIHLVALPEVLLQTAAFSLCLVAWCRRPARWKNVAAIVGIVLVAAMSLLGTLAAVTSKA